MDSAKLPPLLVDEYLTAPRYRISRRIGQVEDLVCVSFSIFFFLLGGFVSVVATAEMIGDWAAIHALQIAATIVGVTGWVLLDFPMMCALILVAIRRGDRVILKVATGRRMLPLILRPIVVIWWIVHFWFVAWIASLFHSFLHTSAAARWLIMIAAFGVSVCANAFLMFSVCAATSSPRPRITVWRYRILVDIAVALFGAIFIQRIIGK